MKPNPLVDSRDVRFVLFEMLEADKLNAFDRFSDYDRDTYEAIIDLAEQIAVDKIYPANAESDKEGARYNPETHEVTAPPSYKAALAYFNEAGFTGLGNDPVWGGMGMPEVITRACYEYFFSASISFSCYVSLSVGAANLIKNFATDADKKVYLEKMISGTWGGTMCLTEPDAGSDVGSLKTKAVRQDDGTYLITGQKIFITGGENDLFENIIHPVLARIEGDPPGTKGISIFLVPKYHVNPDGTPGERNDLICTGIEHKMGLKGSATSSLSFGDNNRCIGYLMGEERQGMKIMFQMMNEARLDVSYEGLGAASSAYLHAVTYARNRVQGFDMTRKGPGPVRIISHPDIRRMLLWMKSQVEAMRMLSYFTAYNIDLSHLQQGEKAREAQAIVEFLIPICKAGNTDLSWLVTSAAIQVYGGYGYCSDYPVEQLARDCKILAIWEGTNGIQSIDLALRKLLQNPGKYNYSIYKKRIQETIEAANGIVDDQYISQLARGIESMDRLVDYLSEKQEKGEMGLVLSNTVPLLQTLTRLSHAWMHLWSLTVAGARYMELAGPAPKGDPGKIPEENREAAFYYGRILSSRFYLGSEFTAFFSGVESIMSGEEAVLLSNEHIFTGAPEE